MSMSVTLYRLTVAQLADVRADPHTPLLDPTLGDPAFLAFLAETGAADTAAELQAATQRTPALPSLAVDKAWHGLHYLLTGGAQGGEAPLAWATTGVPDQAAGPDHGYGPAHYLTPEQVAEVATALGGVTRADLEARFDPAAMSRAHVYPDIWEAEGQTALAWLCEAFYPLRGFYRDASADGAAVAVVMA